MKREVRAVYVGTDREHDTPNCPRRQLRSENVTREYESFIHAGPYVTWI
jgi:hypothetical protein